jgi:hypothetical protein
VLVVSASADYPALDPTTRGVLMPKNAHLAIIAAIASSTCLVTACSKSGPASSGAAGLPGGSTATGGEAAAVAGALGPGGPLDMSKQCAAMNAADVQALMKAPVTKVTVDPGECSFYGGDLKIDLYPGDSTQQYYLNPVGGPGTTPISGVGDQAQWSQAVPEATTPLVEAHKGSLTCVISPADPPETTLVYTGTDPFFKIADSDAAAYAEKEARLCSDAFSVG